MVYMQKGFTHKYNIKYFNIIFNVNYAFRIYLCPSNSIIYVQCYIPGSFVQSHN